MTNDEAMLFSAVVMTAMALIVIYLIGQDNDR